MAMILDCLQSYGILFIVKHGLSSQAAKWVSLDQDYRAVPTLYRQCLQLCCFWVLLYIFLYPSSSKGYTIEVSMFATVWTTWRIGLLMVPRAMWVIDVQLGCRSINMDQLWRLRRWKGFWLFPCFATVVCEISPCDYVDPYLLLLICDGVSLHVARLNSLFAEGVIWELFLICFIIIDSVIPSSYQGWTGFCILLEYDYLMPPYASTLRTFNSSLGWGQHLRVDCLVLLRTHSISLYSGWSIFWLLLVESWLLGLLLHIFAAVVHGVLDLIAAGWVVATGLTFTHICRCCAWGIGFSTSFSHMLAMLDDANMRSWCLVYSIFHCWMISAVLHCEWVIGC